MSILYKVLIDTQGLPESLQEECSAFEEQSVKLRSYKHLLIKRKRDRVRRGKGPKLVITFTETNDNPIRAWLDSWRNIVQ
jgi:hypothetical protein